ncbi:MAG: ATP-binding protein [Planctomycetota bacterium]|jgi:anti-sigma regulatory factor (Ser/Thr protein kinase)
MKIQSQEITVPNSTASLEQVRKFVFEILEDSPFEDRDRRLLVLAIDEAVTSNILFSEATGRGGTTQVALELTADCMRVRIEDTGVDVDPDSEERFEEHMRRARQHEMGIFLVRQIMDEIQYIFRKGYQNELELVRFIYPDRKPDHE